MRVRAVKRMDSEALTAHMNARHVPTVFGSNLKQISRIPDSDRRAWEAYHERLHREELEHEHTQDQ